MNEWIKGQPPLGILKKMDVWIDNDHIREAQAIPSIDYSSLFFTDCTHPMQNAFCPRERIVAYRIQL